MPARSRPRTRWRTTARAFRSTALPVEERYDLVVVGGGISGLAAAWFYRRAAGRTRASSSSTTTTISAAMPGATSSPSTAASCSATAAASRSHSPGTNYSDVAKACCASSGSTSRGSRRAFDRTSLFFARARARRVLLARSVRTRPAGAGRARVGRRRRARAASGQCQAARRVHRRVPDSRRRARRSCVALYDAARDPLAGRNSRRSATILKSTSYRDYLDQVLRLQRRSGELLSGPHARLLRARLRRGAGRGRARPRLSRLRAASGCRARQRGLAASPTSTISPTATPRSRGCWCARCCRTSRPGTRMDDVVLAPFDYGELDRDGQNVRIRLDSTCIDVRNAGDERARRLCARRRARIASRPRHAVLACFHMMIPHIMPELPAAAARRAGAERQDAARLHQRAGAQLAAWIALKVHDISAPMSFSQPGQARFPGQSRRLSSSARSGRADAAASGARAGRAQPGPRRARRSFASASGKLFAMTFADFEDADPRRARPHARRRADSPARATSRRSPSTAGRTATATSPTRCSIARRLRRTFSSRRGSRWPRRDRQFRRRRRRLCAPRHRPGGARGARAGGVRRGDRAL